jgi:hypothetical protein
LMLPGAEQAPWSAPSATLTDPAERGVHHTGHHCGGGGAAAPGAGGCGQGGEHGCRCRPRHCWRRHRAAPFG